MIESSEKTLTQFFHECEKKSSHLFREFVWILKEKCKLNEAEFLSGLKPLTIEQQNILNEWISKKEEDYPIQYFIGSSEFCGLDFYVEPGVLIPRNETEEIALWVLNEAQGRKIKSMMDIGSGSGCLGIGVASGIKFLEKLNLVEPYAEAFTVLEKNIKRHCVKEGLVVDAINKPFEDCVFDETFDLIVSNPPYISYGDKDVENGVYTHEPHEALFSGELGWEKEVLWTQKSYELLNSGGFMVFEISHDQKDILSKKLEEYQPVFHKDSFGKDRFMVIHKGALDG